LVEDCDGEEILFHDQFILRKQYAEGENNHHLVEFTVPMTEPIEAFSPAVEKEFSSAKFLVDLQVLDAIRRYTRQSFSTRKTCIIVFQPRG